MQIYAPISSLELASLPILSRIFLFRLSCACYGQQIASKLPQMNKGLLSFFTVNCICFITVCWFCANIHLTCIFGYETRVWITGGGRAPAVSVTGHVAELPSLLLQLLQPVMHHLPAGCLRTGREKTLCETKALFFALQYTSSLERKRVRCECDCLL